MQSVPNIANRGMRQQMRGEDGNIPAAFNQRGNSQRDNVDPVKEIATETSGRYLPTKIATGSRDDSNVQSRRGQIGKRLPLFDELQKPGLSGRREVNKIVQKQGSGVRDVALVSAIGMQGRQRVPQILEGVTLVNVLGHRCTVDA